MKLFKLAMPALGLLFLGYLIGRLGPEAILHNFATLKWTFPFILLLACTWHITNSIAWSFAFPSGAFRPRLHALFMAKLAGEAVNQLTPLANIGGEPLKAYLLRRESPPSRGLASVVINKTAQIITGLFFTAIGLSLVVLYWTLPRAIPLPIQLGLGILLAIGALLIWFLWRKQQHLFSSLLAFLSRMGVRTDLLERRLAKAVRIDHGISQFYRDCKGRFFLVMFFHSIGWLLGACETFVILRALGAQIDFSVAFLITSLTLLINALFFFMPSNIGVMEGGQVFLLATLGLDPAMGLSLGIAKRMRKIFWISIGWLFLTRLSRNVLQADLEEHHSSSSPSAASDPLTSSRVTFH